jgi:hypothetical protein
LRLFNKRELRIPVSLLVPPRNLPLAASIRQHKPAIIRLSAVSPSCYHHRRRFRHFLGWNKATTGLEVSKLERTSGYRFKWRGGMSEVQFLESARSLSLVARRGLVRRTVALSQLVPRAPRDKHEAARPTSRTNRQSNLVTLVTEVHSTGTTRLARGREACSALRSRERVGSEVALEQEHLTPCW